MSISLRPTVAGKASRLALGALLLGLVNYASPVAGQEPPDGRVDVQQDLENAVPVPRPAPMTPAPDDPAPPVATPSLPVTAVPGETVVLPALTAISLVPQANHTEATPRANGAAVSSAPAASGVVTAPLAETLTPAEIEALADTVAPAVGAAASAGSIDRLREAVEARLATLGRPYVLVYYPEQDVTDGHLTMVVQPARLDGPIAVTGNRWFSQESYRAPFDLADGALIPGQSLTDTVAQVNRNPFREARLIAEPGTRPGTTRLVLRTRDRVPFRPFARFSNAGSDSTDYERLAVGFDVATLPVVDGMLTYQFQTNPGFDRLRSHSVTFAGYIPNGDTLSLFGAYSDSEPDPGLPGRENVSQSFQLGGSYDLGLPTLALETAFDAFEHSLIVGADFKQSRFEQRRNGQSTSDVTTQIVQGSIGYRSSLTDAFGVTGVTTRIVASPGGLADGNTDERFRQSRGESSADYLYGQIDISRTTALPGAFTWTASMSAQFASTPLLGSEQVGGGGASAVRGYEPDEVFRDNRVLLRNSVATRQYDLTGPDSGWPVLVQPFAFVDTGHLWNETTDSDPETLAAIGAGLNLQISNNLVGNVSAGLPLVEGPETDALSPSVHLSLTLSF